jgi:NADPH:quinone reductase-like Zn-dependent oxidoreductase
VALFRKGQRVIGAGGADLEDLRTVLKLAGDGRLRPVIHEVLPLERAGDAHRLIADRSHVGKVILTSERE